MRRFLAWLGRRIWDLVWSIITSAFGTGFLGWLAEKYDIHPDKWVIEMLGQTAGLHVAPYIWWLIFAGSGALTMAAISLVRSIRRRTPTGGVGLAERAERASRLIHGLAAKYPQVMPLDPAYRGSQTNDVNNALYMREYQESIAADAQNILAEAERRELLDLGDHAYARHTVVARAGVEEISRALARVIANVQAGGRKPLPLGEFEYEPPALAKLPQSERVAEFTPMRDAARRAYEVMRKTKGELLEFVEGKAAERPDRAALPVCADKLVLSWGLPLFGERLPSTERELVGSDEFFAADFSDDAGSLISTEDGRKVWANLVVKMEDLPPVLEAIREGRISELLSGDARALHLPLREAAKVLFEAVETLPVAEFIRLEENAKAKIDWAINWMLALDPPAEILGVEPPSSQHRPLIFSKGEPRLIPGTDQLSLRRRVVEKTIIRRSDVARAIDRLKDSVFS